MRIKPEIILQKDDRVSLYKCKSCNFKFTPMDMLSNEPMKGTRKYCPKCKVKFAFTE